MTPTSASPWIARWRGSTARVRSSRSIAAGSGAWAPPTRCSWRPGRSRDYRSSARGRGGGAPRSGPGAARGPAKDARAVVDAQADEPRGEKQPAGYREGRPVAAGRLEEAAGQRGAEGGACLVHQEDHAEDGSHRVAAVDVRGEHRGHGT